MNYYYQVFDQEEIVNHLLGRVLKIISNYPLINNNTTSTDLSTDLSESLLFLYYKNKCSKYNKINKTNKSLSEFIEENKIKTVSNTVLITFALNLFSFVEEVKLISLVNQKISKTQQINVYTPKEDLINKLSFSKVDPLYKLPMIVPPTP